MAEPVKNQDEITTEPVMGAITDRQLLVDMAQKVSSLVSLVKTATDGLSETVQRLAVLESRVTNAEGRIDNASLRAKEPSTHDLEAQAALAAEAEKREALSKEVDALRVETAAQTKILERIEAAAVTWWTSQTGKTVRAIAWGAAVGWALKNNIHIPGIN